MARMAAADGITHIVCSPHANGRYAYDPREIAEKIAELQRLLDREADPVKLGRGCDFHLSYDNIQEAQADPARYSINGLGYLLVELPDYALPPGLTEIFYQMQIAGTDADPDSSGTQSDPADGPVAASGVAARRAAGSGDGRLRDWPHG